MKTFKFGQLLPKEDICNREGEIDILNKLCEPNGRAVVYGPRCYGKSSVVKNVIMADFLERREKSIAIYADFFQVDSLADAVMRLQVAFEEALNRKIKLRSLIESMHNYLKHFRIGLSVDPLSGTPTVALAGTHIRDERILAEIFTGIGNFSEEYSTLLILDEFQDIKHVPTLEARLRAEMQMIDQTAIILLGSKRHILRQLFGNESSPFYGFGTEVKFGAIPVDKWLPYMNERFNEFGLRIKEDSAAEICRLMNSVPSAIQEICQWITLSGQTGEVGVQCIREHLADLVENKAGRCLERIASLSAKEKKVLIAVAHMGPVSSTTSTKFLRATGVSATATRATVTRLSNYGVIEQTEKGASITDPIFRLFLTRKFAVTQ